MQSISPVFSETEVPLERKVAEHQEEYFTVIGLPVGLQIIDKETGDSGIMNDWAWCFRFKLSDDERAAVATGHDLVLTQLTFGKDVTPMNIQFCAAGAKPVMPGAVDLSKDELPKTLLEFPSKDELPKTLLEFPSKEVQ